MFHCNSRHARWGLLSASIAIALVPALAGAQERQEPTTLDRMEVTGSRIKRADLETSQPVFSLTRQEIEKQGLTSIADVLQRISTNGAALNSTFNNGGDGSSGISLRNLGQGRSLVLVNGRRWSSQLDGSVDLNTILSSIIERVEILKDGASTIYGSDAIAGVVNIITRSNYDGAEAGAYWGRYQQGDGNRTSFDFTVGTGNDRGNVMIGASHVEEDAVMAGARAISAGGPPFYAGQSGTGIPGAFANPANPKQKLVLDPVTGKPRAYDAGIDGYNTAPENYLLTPQNRSSLFAQGWYALNDDINFRTEMLYNNRRSEQLLAPMPVTGMKASANSYYNPTNPAGYYKGVVPGGATTLSSISRRFSEAGGRSFNQDVKTWHFYAGLEGTFEYGGRDFDWDVGYRYDRSDNNELTYGLYNVAALSQAYGPSFLDSDGVVKCGSAGNVVPGCIPINPFGPLGSITPEAAAASSFRAHDSTLATSRSFTANFSGSLFDLPAGPFGFAAGFEHRNESGRFEPDAFIAAGLSTGNAAKPTAGSYSLDEYYAEFAIPVLADKPGAQLLDFSLATRYSDYSNFGSTMNHKFGFRWKPINDLLVRGNWSQGFRAPTISDMYAGAGDSYESFIDPCSKHSGMRNNAQVAARCASEGVPGDYEQPGKGSSRQTVEPMTWASNPHLHPETSVSRTLGFVYSPSWLSGFDVSLDWWHIEIENAITRPQVQFILDRCYTGTAGEQAIYCALYTRDPNYSGSPYVIDHLVQPKLNLAAYEVEGWDMTVNYRSPETRAGKFSITWDSTYLSKWNRQAAPDSDFEGIAGLYEPEDPYWRIKSNLSVDWSKGDFGATWGMRYRSGLEEECPFTDDDAQLYCSSPDRVIEEGPAARNHIGAVTYHDVQFRYSAPWNATISVGVNNVFNKQPPTTLTASYNGFDPQYDLPGSFYYLQYRQRF